MTQPLDDVGKTRKSSSICASVPGMTGHPSLLFFLSPLRKADISACVVLKFMVRMSSRAARAP